MELPIYLPTFSHRYRERGDNLVKRQTRQLAARQLGQTGSQLGGQVGVHRVGHEVRQTGWQIGRQAYIQAGR